MHSRQKKSDISFYARTAEGSEKFEAESHKYPWYRAGEPKTDIKIQYQRVFRLSSFRYTAKLLRKQKKFWNRF